MEDDTAVFYLHEFNAKDPSIQIQKRTPIEGSAVGFATMDPYIYGTMATFFESNKESIDFIVSEALKKQV